LAEYAPGYKETPLQCMQEKGAIEDVWGMIGNGAGIESNHFNYAHFDLMVLNFFYP
jgi:hypothetical protein